jgi:hypothetical protein
MPVAILAAVAAAALFALAAALQHRSASLVRAAGPVAAAGPARAAASGPPAPGPPAPGPPAAPGPVAGPDRAALVSATLRHPLWIAGSLASLAGFGLHALALRDGPLTLVQPLLVTGVIFALPLRQVLEHRRPRGAEVGWAAALALGLAGFITIATPAAGAGQAADPRPAVICLAVIALGIPGCCAAGRRAAGDLAAAALGTAAGLAFAATAALLKETVSVASRGAGALLASWPGYAMLAAGAAGLLLSQLAYRAGPLRASLPAITTVNPIVSLVIGVTVFDEGFRTGAPYLAGELLGLALIAAAGVGLTRTGPGRESGAGSAERGRARPAASRGRARRRGRGGPLRPGA